MKAPLLISLSQSPCNESLRADEHDIYMRGETAKQFPCECCQFEGELDKRHPVTLSPPCRLGGIYTFEVLSEKKDTKLEVARKTDTRRRGRVRERMTTSL